MSLCLDSISWMNHRCVHFPISANSLFSKFSIFAVLTASAMAHSYKEFHEHNLAINSPHTGVCLLMGHHFDCISAHNTAELNMRHWPLGHNVAKNKHQSDSHLSCWLDLWPTVKGYNRLCILHFSDIFFMFLNQWMFTFSGHSYFPRFKPDLQLLPTCFGYLSCLV